MSATAQPFIDYLEQLQRQGETHVHLDNQATEILREFYKKAAGLPESVGVTDKAPVDSTQTETPTPTTTPTVELGKGSKAQQIDTLRAQVSDYAPIKKLKNLRETMVFSSGNPDADIMLIGEYPGFHDEKTQLPFSGKAGEKLDGILKAMGLSREDVYISYIVKYRPAMANQATASRTPTEDEIWANKVFVAQEIKIVEPKVILALGSKASQVLLRSEDSFESLRGQFHKPFNIPVRATFPPSYLLNNEAKSDKRAVWEDMLATMELLEMPITEKQRGFFL